MKWFRQVQQRIRSLKEQNTGGGKTEYVDAHDTPKLPVGSTEHFTIYTVSPTTHKLFMVMPRTSMYIDVDEARELYKLLLTSITTYIEHRKGLDRKWDHSERSTILRPTIPPWIG